MNQRLKNLELLLNTYDSGLLLLQRAPTELWTQYKFNICPNHEFHTYAQDSIEGLAIALQRTDYERTNSVEYFLYTNERIILPSALKHIKADINLKTLTHFKSIFYI